MFKEKDVVKIISGKCKGLTGVVTKQLRENQYMTCVQTKGNYFGVWHFNDTLKRIGSTKRKVNL